MSEWQTKKIEEKFHVAKQLIDLKIEIEEWKKRKEFLAKEKEKELLKNEVRVFKRFQSVFLSFLLQEIHQNILETQKKKQKLMAHHAQLTEHRK